MASTYSTEGLARVSSRRPWLTVAIWVVALVLAATASRIWLSDALTTDITFANRPESVAGLGRIGEAGLDESAGLSETIAIQSTSGQTVDDPAFEAKVTGVTTDVRAMVEGWQAAAGEAARIDGPQSRPPVVNYYELAAFGLPQADALVSEDRRTTLVSLHFPGDPIAYVEIDELLDYAEAQNDAAFTVHTVGTLSVNERFSQIAEQDLVKGESIGIPMAMVILVIVFGALVAAAVPVVLAVVSVGIALGITALIGQVWELSLFIQNMITMIGLAVGIDYALFVVERFREERLSGHDKQRAIERAGA